MTTDISEKGLESRIVRHMTGTDGLAVAPNTAAEPPAPWGGTGYIANSPKDSTGRMRWTLRSSSPSCAPRSRKPSRSWRWSRPMAPRI